MFLSRVLPVGFRNGMRRSIDSLYCRSYPDKETIGEASQWTIRTEGLSAKSVVYSGGVGEDISFETALIERFGLSVRLFDPSPVALRTLERVLEQNKDLEPHLVFKPVGLAESQSSSFVVGGGEGNRTWFRAGGEGDGMSVPCTSVPAEMKANGDTAIDLLKIDIEGFEYGVLDSCLDENVRIRQVCVEFHHFFPEIPRSETTRVVSRLRERGFELIHKQRFDCTFYRKTG